MKLFTFLIVFSIGLNVFSQDHIIDELKKFCLDKPENTQLSIAIIKDGTTIYYGVIKQNNSIQLIENKDYLFEIGSITKVFTSTLLTQLITEGKINKKSTINQTLKHKTNLKTKVKLIELANHTSGLPTLPQNFLTSNFIPTNPYKNYSSTEFDHFLKNEVKTMNSPGSNYQYSNMGAGLLGYSLGISQGKNYFELLQHDIFDKYGLENSYYSNSQIINKTLVKGMNSEGNETSNWDFDVLAGAGCIISSASDLAKFAKVQFDSTNKAILMTQTPTFVINDKMKIGLGWHILTQQSNNNEYIWHNGATGGYSSSMALNVKNKTGVIILSNLSSINESLDKLCLDFLNKFNQ